MTEQGFNLGERREVCWDEALWDGAPQGQISVKQHHPQYRGVALTCDAPWEGCDCMYFQLIPDGRIIRLYYRGSDAHFNAEGVVSGTHPNYWCYAQSRDGKTFERIPLGVVPIPGQDDNNVFFPKSQDNVHVYRDDNPDCPEDEQYKALVGTKDQTLEYWKSADGIHFTFARILVDDGAYDSMNVVFYDPLRKKYFLYYRGMHGSHSAEGKWEDSPAIEYHNHGLIRDVRVRTSEDFVTWGEPQRILFDEGQEDYELYTNQVQPYYRAPHVFLGIPTRYCDRWQEEASFPYLPDHDARYAMIRKEGRTGTAMTDNVLMTTRDGVHFRRTDEAFMTPEPEDGNNWYYGNCYAALGMMETESDRPGMPNELSIYCGRNYRSKDIELCRYVLRLDGFFSWNGSFQGGSVLTKPLTFEGDSLNINFATSALGYVRIRILDESGALIEGYDSGRLFGDSVRRPVDFAKDLRELIGKTVRLKVELKDADLYSFRFEKRLDLASQTGSWTKRRKGRDVTNVMVVFGEG